MKKSVLLTLLLLTTRLAYSQEKKVEAVDENFKQFLNCRDFTMSGDVQEAYFTVQNVNESRSIIVSSKMVNGHWDDFKMLSFSGKYRDIEPCLSPDQLRLYFSSNRPLKNSSGQAKDYDIWYVERETVNDAWSLPVNLGAPVNTAANEFYPSVSNSNNIYYTSDALADSRKDDIFFSAWDGEQYSSPVSLPLINSERYEFNAFIAPDEDFIIYTIYQAPDGLGSGDLYISYKNKAGEFGEGRHLGALINSDKMDYCPFYDPKNKILYFTSKRDQINDTAVKDLSEFSERVKQYANGLSRIYKVSIDLSTPHEVE